MQVYVSVCVIRQYVIMLYIIYIMRSLNWTMGGSPRELSEELVTWEKRKKGWRMSCDVGEATEGLENELWRR